MRKKIFPNKRLQIRLSVFSILGLVILTSYQNCSSPTGVTNAFADTTAAEKIMVTDVNLDPVSTNVETKIYVLEQFSSDLLSTYLSRPIVTLKLFSTGNLDSTMMVNFHLQVTCQQAFEGNGTMERQSGFPLNQGNLDLQTLQTAVPTSMQNPEQCPPELFENEFQFVNWVDVMDFLDNINSYRLDGARLMAKSSEGRWATFLPIDKFMAKDESQNFRQFISSNSGHWNVSEFQGNPCHDGGSENCHGGGYQTVSLKNLKLELQPNGDVIVDGICEKLTGKLRSASENASGIMVEARFLNLAISPLQEVCEEEQSIENEYGFHILKYIRTLHRNQDKLIITTQGGNSLILKR